MPSRSESFLVVIRYIAVFLLVVIYATAKSISLITKRLVKRKSSIQRVIINGTFHNPNWFHAHIEPIVKSGYGEVILICDTPLKELPGLTYRCPPIWVCKLLSRAGAKALWTFIQGIKHPADVYVGYHIFPSAITALICARLLGAKVVYQLTSGQLELEGGGWNAENKLLTALRSPSRLAEYFALAVTREFDLAVVRGSGALNYLKDRECRNPIEVVTGSVDTSLKIAERKDIDLILVGRLTEYKRPERFLQIVKGVTEYHPSCHAVIIGDGPDRQQLELTARDLGIQNQVEFLGQRSDVPQILARAKVFVLTSRWEGVSIAMLEAMAMQAVPVVSDVGDLKDFARNDLTGFVFAEDDLESAIELINNVLCDDVKRHDLAQAARDLVVSKCDRNLLAQRWNSIFLELSSHL